MLFLKNFKEYYINNVMKKIQEGMDSLSTKNVQKYGSTYQALDNLNE